MFSLQRMLDDIGRRRQERRFASQSKARLIEAVERVYGVSVETLQDIFSLRHEGMASEGLPPSLELRDLEEIGVSALLLRQTIEVAQAPRYIIAVREGREEISKGHYRKVGFNVLLKQEQEFSGINMRLVTNDMALLRRLANGGFNPPCPWVAFHELGPYVGSMQGNAEYWYRHTWDRFWEGLSLAEQTRFLEQKRRETAAHMSEDEWRAWVEGLRFRDPGTRASIP